MRFTAQIEISTKDGVLNPESKAILQALQGHNFPILDLTLNKRFYITLESKDKKSALKTLETACQDLLSNPVIQDYKIDIESK